jgi:TonB family protein
MKLLLTLLLLVPILYCAAQNPLPPPRPVVDTGTAGEMSAIARDTVYYDMLWKKTTADKRYYYRIQTRTAAGWRITDYYPSGKRQMSGGYADDSFHISQGEWAWYDSGEIVIHRCNYSNSKLNGPDSIYYPKTGRLEVAGANKDGKPQGEWTGYYPSGKISGKAKYESGQQKSGTYYHEDGSRNQTITRFMQEADYPGGPPQWLRFLNKNLQYPDSAVVYEIEGTVVIGFKVSRDGRVSEITVAQPVNKYLDQEALRVVNQMALTDWTPAIIGGVLTDTYKRQPIVFKLQAE